MHQPWGYGLGKSGHIAWRLFKDTNTPSSPYSTDGWYLKLLGETGILGALFFSGLLSYIIYQSRKSKLMSNQTISTYISTVLVFVLVQNIVSNVFDYFILAPLIFLLLGYYTQLFYAPKD